MLHVKFFDVTCNIFKKLAKVWWGIKKECYNNILKKVCL